MDTRNVIAAISLSAAVIILYGLFFAPETKKLSQNQDTISKNEIVVEDDESPKIEEKNKENILTRSEAVRLNERVSFENKNIVGSINLTGAIIDDLTFKNYTLTLNGMDNVILFNPKNSW